MKETIWKLFQLLGFKPDSNGLKKRLEIRIGRYRLSNHVYFHVHEGEGLWSPELEEYRNKRSAGG
jgi:hypothetical protein